MIVEFSVKNYRSIKDLQTLSFEATDIVSNSEKYPDIDKNNIVEVGDMRLLKTVGIYGANASGKSNVVRAFLDFCKVISNSPSPDDLALENIRQPFLYHEDTSIEDTYFQIVMAIDSVMYRYGLTVGMENIDITNKKNGRNNHKGRWTLSTSNGNTYLPVYKISYEWLYRYENGNKIQLFLRKGNQVESEILNAKKIPEIPYEHTLYLTHVASFQKSICSVIWSLMNKIVDVNNRFDTNYLLDSSEGKARLISYLSYFDLDYTDIYKVESNIDKSVKIYLKKWRNLGDATFELDEHESMGTRRIYKLAGTLITILDQEESSILVLDEIDSNLHPRLVIRLIQIFNDPEINKSKSQLLFTSHDTNLMNPGIMRRDQFYFTEKNQDEETWLDSLSDLKGIPNDADFARQYLAGLYGGVPTLRNSQFEPVAEDA